MFYPDASDEQEHCVWCAGTVHDEEHLPWCSRECEEEDLNDREDRNNCNFGN